MNKKKSAFRVNTVAITAVRPSVLITIQPCFCCICNWCSSHVRHSTNLTFFCWISFSEPRPQANCLSWITGCANDRCTLFFMNSFWNSSLQYQENNHAHVTFRGVDDAVFALLYLHFPADISLVVWCSMNLSQTFFFTRCKRSVPIYLPYLWPSSMPARYVQIHHCCVLFGNNM